MKDYKIGDRLFVLSMPRVAEVVIGRVGEVVDIDKGDLVLTFEFEHNRTRRYFRNTDCLVLEHIYNSPLYQALS